MRYNLFRLIKNYKQEFLFITVFIGVVVLIAISLLIYIKSPVKTEGTFETCYKNCVTLGTPSENGKCEKNSHLEPRRTRYRNVQYNNYWCYLNADKCLSLCKRRNE